MKKKIQKLVSFLMVCMLNGSMMVVNVSAGRSKSITDGGNININGGAGWRKGLILSLVFTRFMDAK